MAPYYSVKSQKDHCRRPGHQHLLQQCRFCHYLGYREFESTSAVVLGVHTHQKRKKKNAHIITQELFIQYLAEQGHNVAKLDKKPRRNVQYKDLCKHS